MEVPRENGRFERLFAFQPTGTGALRNMTTPFLRQNTRFAKKKSLESLEALTRMSRLYAMLSDLVRNAGKVSRR